MTDAGHDRARLVRSIERQRNVPLDRIDGAVVRDIVNQIVVREEDRVTVDVARFGSSI